MSKERRITDLLHLIADVELGRIKEQKNEVAACRKPPTHLNEVVGTLYTHRWVRPSVHVTSLYACSIKPLEWAQECYLPIWHVLD